MISAALLTMTALFIASVVLALGSLFTPGVYRTVVDSSISETSFAKELRNADKTITDVGQSVNSVIGKIQTLFGSTPQQEYKSDLYNQFVDFITGLLRIIILVLSIIIMLVVTYFRYSYASIIEVKKLRKEMDELRGKEA